MIVSFQIGFVFPGPRWATTKIKERQKVILMCRYFYAAAFNSGLCVKRSQTITLNVSVIVLVYIISNLQTNVL